MIEKDEKIEVLIEKTKTGYSAYAKGHGVLSVADSLREVHQKILEALQLHYEQPEIVPAQLLLSYDLACLFEAFPALNVKALAAHIQMNYQLLHNYITGQKKPSSAQVTRILDGIHEIGRDLARVQVWTA